MSRFYVPQSCIQKDRIIVRGDELHHARDVMRLKAGDSIAVFDGTGNEYHGVIDEVGKAEMTASIEKTVSIEPDNCRLTLIQALPKSDKMDLIVEKATELGAEKIIPVITERTVVRMETGRTNVKLDRWRKIAIVAAKQSGRSTIPEIFDITEFRDALNYIKNCELSVIPCLYEGTKSLRQVLRDKKIKSASVFIGPEGDFTEDEIEQAKTAGAIPVSLGKEVLRSETAAITALSVLNYELRW